MKKNFYLGFIALTALTVTSCSNDDVVMQSPDVNKAIEFGTYLGRDAQSRGSVITQGGDKFTDAQQNEVTTLSLKEKGFGVFAYYTDESGYVADATTGSPCNFMYNQLVDWNVSEGDTDWTYSPIKYWPNDPGDKLTFFAYAPYDDANTDAPTDGTDNISFSALAGMKGDPVITFTVNEQVNQQTDLLFSKTDNKNKVKNTGVTVTDKVNFQFAHALARIGFNVRAVTDEVAAGSEKLDENTIIVVKKVILSGAAHNSAVDANFVAPSTGAFYKSGTLNLNQQGVNYTTITNTNEETGESTTTYTAGVVWTVVENADKQIFTLKNGNFVEQDTDYDDQGYVITGGANGNSVGPNRLNADDSYIMIIPQDFSTNGFYVYVEYDVITKDENLGNTANTEYDNLKSKITNHISTQVTGINFQSGKAYTLNLQLGMTSVKVTASVDPWVDEEPETEVDLPQNTQGQ